MKEVASKLEFLLSKGLHEKVHGFPRGSRSAVTRNAMGFSLPMGLFSVHSQRVALSGIDLTTK